MIEVAQASLPMLRECADVCCPLPQVGGREFSGHGYEEEVISFVCRDIDPPY